MKAIIQKYITYNNKENQRYNSWNHCFEAFGTLQDAKLLSLHLGFYLASWGMYRGSSKLLERDYLVHIKAVKIIQNYSHLRYSSKHKVCLADVPAILNLIQELSEYYKDIHNVTPTDTLISKIILGTLGCIPAFDRFFIAGVKQHNYTFKTLKKNSLEKLFLFQEQNLLELNIIQEKLPEYPPMKIIDMYFWQIGFEKSKTDTIQRKV
tara:strand:+ start:2921 stop:3544 length:624 start_codon:yes stop_codon:yes gene_type:complete